MDIKSITKMLGPIKAFLPKEFKELLDSGILERFPEMIAGSLQPNETYLVFRSVDGKDFKLIKSSWVLDETGQKFIVTPLAEVTLASIFANKEAFSEADQKILNKLEEGKDK